MELPERFAPLVKSREAHRPYMLLGLGARRKLVFRGDRLLDASDGQTVSHWPGAHDVWVQPDSYQVHFDLSHHKVIDDPDGSDVWDHWPMRIRDTADGTWLGNRRNLATAGSIYSLNIKGEFLSEAAVALPRFEHRSAGAWEVVGHPYAPVLRVLHQEILFNIKDGAPLPNLFVYSKPWYRDAAMVCMVLERTGNLHLVRDWILSLREPFDRNNAGHEEPDNLGQALYLVSLVSDRSHPLVRTVLEQIPRFRRGDHIAGLSDFAEHPVYQTKWLKFGLRRLGLDDPFVIPRVPDGYSALFWWDYKDEHVDDGRRFSPDQREKYPYLGWAEDHFYGVRPDVSSLVSQGVYTGPYPLTWESHASQANYEGMRILSEDDARNNVCRPHTWHAAEMFLYLHELG